MAKKRPAPSAAPTDEWGIYDPAKAGMQALYSRLGRPILRASAAAERRERKRAGRPQRPAEGVGLAIEEARRRAALLSAGQPAQQEPAPASDAPARAARAPRAKAAKAKAPRRRPATAAPTTAKSEPAGTHAVAPPAAGVEEPAARRARKTPRARPHAEAPAVAVPQPSPRRPRGPVPLAAWAHAVNDTPAPEPKRSEGKGLWRGIFRIPSEVALVEYGRGCRIHRLVIETPPNALSDQF